MSRPSNPFVLHTLLGIVLLVAVMFLLPEGTGWWRRVLAGIFSITLGHQIATAWQARARGGITLARATLECLSFPLLIFAVLKMPETQGWILLLAGFSWRPLVGKLWKKPDA